MPAKVDKVLVTNFTALQAKYSPADLRKIKTALQGLIAADRQRGLVTRLLAVDDPEAMRQLKAPPVKTAANARQNKDAIDGIYKALAPDYLLIVGSIDVIPHQNLKNLLYSPPDDPDKVAFGDLPYACEAPYSTDPLKFFGPTRVVGRLPDLTGAGDPQYLTGLLGVASTYKSVDAASYRRYFGISAEIWEQSTALSLKNTFGNSSDMKTIPPSSSKWPASLLGRLSHFINCHGAPNDTGFYGQPASGKQIYPTALDAAYVNKKISAGTIAAAECCYGAQLYRPSLTGGRPGICSTYLSNRAYAFFGSTTIAYGPADGNDEADLICQFFLQSILEGASLGRAALEARQKFVHTASMSDPSNVKTISQFNLYGDPSLTPVKAAHAAAPPTQAGAKAVSFAAYRVDRAERRRDLFSRGLALANSQPVIRKVAQAPAGRVRAALRRAAKAGGISATRTLTFTVKAPPTAKAMPAALVKKELVPDRVHVIFGEHGSKEAGGTPKGKASYKVVPPPVVRTVAMIVKEADGKVVSAKKIFSR